MSRFVAIVRVTPGEHNHRMDFAASSSANRLHSRDSSAVALRPLTVRRQTIRSFFVASTAVA
jgi:hypothetical protein